VLALSFPLHPPGRPEKSRAGELLGAAEALPVLVVQGGNDPFGRPAEFTGLEGTAGFTGLEGASGFELCEVVGGDHGFAVPKRGPVGQEAALGVIADAVIGWCARLG
jgi:predicted alpha/beta-hydrolase family hydrolase